MQTVVKLVNEWARFDEAHPQGTLEAFCRYYLAQQETSLEDSVPGEGGRLKNVGSLLKILGRITSAFTLYHRASMQKTALSTPESFFYLNGLAHLGEVRKTELINYLFAEYTTGMEAINRLLHEELISERVDPSDGRAKLISLTEKGKGVLPECYMYTGKAGEMLFEGVPDETINLCIQLLADVESKHSRLAVQLKNKDFEEMYQQVMSGM